MPCATVQGETRTNWSLFRITVDLSTMTQTRDLCIQFKNFIHDLKDKHLMKCLGRKLFPSKHDIYFVIYRSKYIYIYIYVDIYFVSHHGTSGKMNACRALVFSSFLVSCLPHRSLLQSLGSSWNINLILLIIYSPQI